MRLPQKGSVQPSETAARPSRGEIRRLVLMAVGAVIILFFIGRSILQLNRSADRSGAEVGVSRDPQVAPPAPDSLPDGRQIVLPHEGDAEALAGVVDFTELEVDDPAFLFLVKSVMEQSPAEIAARVEPLADYTQNAAGNRGRYVRAVGTLDHLEPLWLPRDNPSGVDRVWWGHLINRNRDLIQVIVPELEREFREKYDTVLVEGPFFKARRSVIRAGTVRDFPLVIGRVMKHVREPTYEETFPSELGYVVAGTVVLVLVTILLASRRAARRDAAVDRVRRSRRRSGPGKGRRNDTA